MKVAVSDSYKKDADLPNQKREILHHLRRVEELIQELELHLQEGQTGSCPVHLNEIKEVQQELKKAGSQLILMHFQQSLTGLVSCGFEEAKFEELLQLLRRYSRY